MVLKWFSDDLNYTCPHWCKEIWCKWECLKFEKHNSPTEKFDEKRCWLCWNIWCFWKCQIFEILSILDNYSGKKEYNPELLLEKDFKFDLSEKCDYSDKIKEIKSYLYDLLLVVIDTWIITWAELIKLWNEFKIKWLLIEWYLFLSSGKKFPLEEKNIKKIEKIEKINLNTEDKENQQTPILVEIIWKLENKLEGVFIFLGILVKAIENRSWKDIASIWEVLIELWNEISILEITKKSLEIKTWDKLV